MSEEAMEGNPESSARPRSKALDGEEELVARARAGDTAAFEALVVGYRDRAYGLALRVVGSAADAEEVAQDAFVRAWRALPNFRGEARFSTWLYRIVMRRACDSAAQVRRRRVRETGLEEIAELPASPGAGAGALVVEGRLGPGGSSRLIAVLLDELSEAQRAVVVLHYLEEKTVQEIGAILEMPDGTVKTHLFRARARLRDGWRRAQDGVRIHDV